MWVRRWLKRGTFPAVADLRERILACITSFHHTMAQPFKWTYTGRPMNYPAASCEVSTPRWRTAMARQFGGVKLVYLV
jgi:hypothetical protein